MEEISNIAGDTLINYFATISIVGSLRYAEVDKAIIVAYIEEVFDGPFRSFISNEDYRIMNDTLYNICGSSCLIPYPQYVLEEETSSADAFRISTDSTLRYTQGSDPRKVTAKE